MQALLTLPRNDDWEAGEQEAFGLLRDSILQSVCRRPSLPRRQLLDDQIIWGRCPVRLDLAGGWTDTPPFCLTHGGRVVNVAVDLNGQPPIQVFAKLCNEPQIVLRSIDRGVEGRVTTFDELRRCGEPLGDFSIAKAALSLAGFLPEFSAGQEYRSLRQQLEDFGGGLEISLLAAVPKGSGLGTSSILAATLLGSLGELCGLGWDHAEIYRRALALEQMLTTGGGWQDQVGGVARGLKRIDTLPGLQQDPVVRWLPADLFTDTAPKSCMLLYYTGITRMAKSILKEIVRGVFLKDGRRLALLDELGEHAAATYEVLARGQWDGLCRCIRRSWELNQQLDTGTNPAEVQAILDRVSDCLAAAKLLGAGGGGYMLMIAKDRDAAIRVRKELQERPPSRKARFVDFGVSDTGLEITRS
jgi:galactokinase/mevalonate kinase-like predicted kinase